MDLGFSIDSIAARIKEKSKARGAKAEGRRRKRALEEAGKENRGDSENAKRPKRESPAKETGCDAPDPRKKKLSRAEVTRHLDSIAVLRREDLPEVSNLDMKDAVQRIVAVFNQIQDEPERPRFPDAPHHHASEAPPRRPERKRPGFIEQLRTEKHTRGMSMKQKEKKAKKMGTRGRETVRRTGR